MIKGQRSRGRRQGNVFSLRITPELRERLEAACAADSGPKRLGPWLIWRALGPGTAVPGEALPALAPAAALPGQRGRVPSPLWPLLDDGDGRVGITAPAGLIPPPAERVILDLCAGSGSWSEPYKLAGYDVRRVTLPALDVHTFVPPELAVWGVLAAPPCEEFSLAKNGRDRDFRRGLETVSACLRVIWTVKPRWWALENPVGLLSRWLGRPQLVFEPYQFGDLWSKRTAIWGSFAEPQRGPYVQPIDGGGPLCVVCYPDAPAVCSVASHRAVTPPGFARAFFEANP